MQRKVKMMKDHPFIIHIDGGCFTWLWKGSVVSNSSRKQEICWISFLPLFWAPDSEKKTKISWGSSSMCYSRKNLALTLSCIFSCSLTCHEHNCQMLHFSAHSTHTHIHVHMHVHAHILGGTVHFSPQYLLWIKQYILNMARDDQAIKRTKMMVWTPLFLYENSQW